MQRLDRVGGYKVGHSGISPASSCSLPCEIYKCSELKKKLSYSWRCFLLQRKEGMSVVSDIK